MVAAVSPLFYPTMTLVIPVLILGVVVAQGFNPTGEASGSRNILGGLVLFLIMVGAFYAEGNNLLFLGHGQTFRATGK